MIWELLGYAGAACIVVILACFAVQMVVDTIAGAREYFDR